MFCKHCGKQIDKLTHFCQYCGTKINMGKRESLIKHCPFCKKEININDEKCQSCEHVLVEKISSNEKKKSTTDTPSNSRSENNIFSKLISLANRINYFKLIFNKYVLIFLGLIFIIWLLSGDDTTYKNGGTKIQLPTPVKQTSNKPIDLDLSAFDESLTNGTVFKKNSFYFRGDGELQIKNGTSLDAVAKLIRDGASVLTVYIKANNTYTITGLSDGIYWLAFVQGSDWNSIARSFRQNTQYSVFEDTFNFITTNSQYTIFEVTLNPVKGGTAKTSSVDPEQFDAY